MRHNPPYISIVMSPEIAWPRIQQIHYPSQHHPTNTKQAKDHTPHLICYRSFSCFCYSVVDFLKSGEGGLGVVFQLLNSPFWSMVPHLVFYWEFQRTSARWSFISFSIWYCHGGFEPYVSLLFLLLIHIILSLPLPYFIPMTWINTIFLKSELIADQKFQATFLIFHQWGPLLSLSKFPHFKSYISFFFFGW